MWSLWTAISADFDIRMGGGRLPRWKGQFFPDTDFVFQNLEMDIASLKCAYAMATKTLWAVRSVSGKGVEERNRLRRFSREYFGAADHEFRPFG